MVERDKGDKPLPLRSLHDFLFEIESEWTSFRTGSLLSLISTGMLFILFIPRYLLITLRQGRPFDKMFALVFSFLLLYSSYSSWKQHKFYQKWDFLDLEC